MGSKGQKQQQASQNALMNAQISALNQSNELTRLQAEDYKKFQPKINEIQDINLANVKADASSPVWGQQRSLGESIMGDVKGYQPIGFNNPLVQEIQGYLNNQGADYAKDMLNMQANESAAMGDFGSSYRASQRAGLGDKLARLQNENAINSLNLASQIYNTNTGLVDWAFGSRPEIPSIQAPQVQIPNVQMPQYASSGSTASQLGGMALMGLAQNPNMGSWMNKGYNSVKSVFK